MKTCSRATTALVTGIIVAIAVSNAAAAQITIDFETVAGVTPTGFGAGSAVAANARLADQLLGSYGVRFASESQPYAALVNLGVGHATSGSRGIGAVTSLNTLSYADGIIVRFVDPANAMSPAVTNEVSFRIDNADTSNNPVRLEAYNLGGALLAFDEKPDSAGATFHVSAPSIHRVHLIGSGSSAFDDLSFNALMPVPEPSPVGLVVGAWLATSAFRRRRAGGAA